MTKYSKIRALEHHLHELKLKPGTEPFECNGCKEKGYHLRYACKKCQFHLHEACAKKFGDLYQDPFKRYNLEFCASLPSTGKHNNVFCHGCGGKHNKVFLCHGCGGNVNGYVYAGPAGKTTKKVLHPCCAALPAQIEAPGDVRLELRRKLSSRCRKCGEVKLGGKRDTWGYVSADHVVQIHVACANELFHEEYVDAMARRPHGVASLMARLKNMLSGAETSTTEGTARGGRVILPELPAGLPTSPTTTLNSTVLVEAVWWTLCTVGAVLTGNPVAISPLLLQLFSPAGAQ